MALVLIGTGQQMALARGQATAAGEIILCQGGVAVAVAVDQSGNPVGKRHICPDCAAHFFAATFGPTLVIAPSDRARAAVRVARITNPRSQTPQRTAARDPPFQSDFT
jgi:hypothetical protein